MQHTLLVGLLLLESLNVVTTTTKFTVDVEGKTSRVWPFWESCTTYDHAYPALRSDWQRQLKLVHDELGTKQVRFMGIFDDDIGIVNPKYPHSPYSYLNSDLIYDYILSIGMKPVIELDFVPSAFLKDPQSHLSKSVFAGFPAYKGPPDNDTQWEHLVYDFVSHLVDRYGANEVATWMFDQWDEPNTGKWVNTNLTTYEETYSRTAKAVRAINSTFRLGAPGTANADWIPQFPQWSTDKKVGLDWVSTHLYPTNSYCKNRTHDGFYLCLQHLSNEIRQINNKYGIGITAYGCEIQNDYSKPGPHDTSYNAACFATFASQFQKLDSNQFVIMSFTGFTDLWDQVGMYAAPFHDGYGWLTNRGIKKPTFHALRLLHQYATGRKYFVGVNSFLDQSQTSLELFATIDDSRKSMALFVMNWVLPGHGSITTETVVIDITGSAQLGNVKHGTLYRIDDDHCNPQVVWQNMGAPFYPTEAQMSKMANASNTYPIPVKPTSNSQVSVTFSFDVPTYGMAVLLLDLE